MSKYYETLTSTNGDVLVGFRVQVLDNSGNIVQIDADASGTRFQDSLGANVNYTTSDELGYYEFYWTPASGQDLQVLDSGGNLIRPPVTDFAENYLASNLGDIPQSQVIDLETDLAGKADTTALDAKADINTYSTLTTLKAAEATTLTYNLVGTSIDGVFFYETENAPYTADDVDTIKLDSVALSVGALVRHTAATPSIRRRLSKSGGVIAVAEQAGTTIYDRLKVALAECVPGDIVIGESGTVDRASGAAITIKSGTKLFCNGMQFAPSVTQAYAVQLEDNADNVEIHDLYIDSGGNTTTDGNSTSAAFFANGPHNLTLVNPIIKGWSGYAIDCKSSTTRGLDGVRIINPYIHSPGTAVTHPIIMRSGTGGIRGKRVYIDGGKLWGTDPKSPALADYALANQYTADFIVFQGIQGGHIRGTDILYSGSAGISVTRGSEDITMQDVLAEMCYEPGFNLGSGLEIVHVADIAGFALAAGVTSAAAGVTSGTISAINADSSGTGGWLWIESVAGGTFDNGDDINQGGAASTIDVSGAGERDEGYSVIPSGFNLKVLNCTSVDTAIQGGAAAYNAIRCRGETLIHGCSYENPRGQGAATHFVSNSHSNIGLGGGNLWKDRPINDALLQTSGAFSWIYKLDQRVGLVATGRTNSNGTENFWKGFSCTKTGVGVYVYTFDEELETADYVINTLVATSNGDALPSSQTTTGFTITTRSSGTATDLTHYPTVIL